MSESGDDVLWTVKDVAAFLQVPERKVWNRLRGSGYAYDRIPMVELDGKPRFIPSQVLRWKEAFGHKLHKLTPQEEYRRWQQTQRTAASSAGRTSQSVV